MGYKGSASELKNGCCRTVQLRWVRVHRRFLCCRTSSPLSTGHATYATLTVLLLLCLQNLPTDFLLSVVVYTDTQCARFLKLPRGMLILTLWRHHPPHTLVQDFSDNLLKLLSGKHTPSDESRTGKGCYVSSCKWIYLIYAICVISAKPGNSSVFWSSASQVHKGNQQDVNGVFLHLAKLFRFQKLWHWRSHDAWPFCNWCRFSLHSHAKTRMGIIFLL